MLKFSKARFLFLLTFTLVSSLSFSGFAHNKKLEIKLPPAVMKGLKTEIRLEGTVNEKFTPQLLINGVRIDLNEDEKGLFVDHVFEQKSEIQLIDTHVITQKKINPIPLWLSILPPLIAIIMALLTKEVFSSLFVGLLFGSACLFKYAGANFFIAIAKGGFAVVDTYLMHALLDKDHLSIIIFCMLIGGMVTLISMNGGMKGIVNILSKYAKSRRSGQFITYLMGLLIFFDDYANTLVVGNTMRPVTDKLKISREKLAYIVDSTSAPIAAIAFITTWIGAELSYIQEGITSIGLQTTAYAVFLQSLKYSFYPILTLAFVGILIWQRRDFGPMLKSEKQAVQNKLSFNKSDKQHSPQIMKELSVSDNIQARWFNALIPVLVVIIGTISGLIYTGWEDSVWNSHSYSFTGKLSQTIGNADIFTALIWSSLAGVFAALVLTSAQRLLSLKESIEGLINGFKTMFHALLILSLAWSLALLTKHLHTADFITNILVGIEINPMFIPALTFLFSAFIAFSTGSSWGTMAIIYPLMLPAVYKIGQEAGLGSAEINAIFYNVVSCVLAGSVLGDHCSPISDTTILSSLACSCNHIHHVRTQMPYAITVALIAILGGTIPTAFGFPIWISYLLCFGALFMVIKLMGKRV
ncbi:Na+/H+ antiporter NhaC family protein [Carboxylicivirga sp. N1Y90]|uniref:Na+/H+ antiporter NhaC family protein n=1 Tax=Carboxylicivirga fragile TaxID=3417571 RepID=UPI003D34B1A2|nr:Na+/H+ antiporter NhaC family protein [Marinilabiliaceae bacterium N1Y90]